MFRKFRLGHFFWSRSGYGGVVNENVHLKAGVDGASSVPVGWCLRTRSLRGGAERGGGGHTCERRLKLQSCKNQPG